MLQAQLELLRAGDRDTFDACIRAAERATGRLTQLVSSLLEHSRLDAGRPPTTATVESLIEEAGEAIHLVTTVADDGPGISSDFLPPAFDRFSLEDKSRGGTHGSGLGLAIVAAAAAKAGGMVTLENAHPSGLVVKMTVHARHSPPTSE